jgi:hypothetical protein
MEKFLEKSVGKKYEASVTKFMKNKSTFNGIAEDRTFFCSELVAKAFKLLGIIQDDDTSCSQFFPGHFATAGDKFLKLNHGVYIENEMQVVVRSEELAKESNLIKHQTTGAVSGIHGKTPSSPSHSMSVSPTS